MAKRPPKAKKPVANPSKPSPTKGEPKTVEAATVQQTQAAFEPRKIDLTKPIVREAIAQGMAIIKEGKSKADAARAMYAVLKDEDKDLIVAAFVKGATLTEKGALTYWYNCRRKVGNDEKKSPE